MEYQNICFNSKGKHETRILSTIARNILGVFTNMLEKRQLHYLYLQYSYIISVNSQNGQKDVILGQKRRHTSK